MLNCFNNLFLSPLCSPVSCRVFSRPIQLCLVRLSR
nr:MAG TPA: hypothetical protein [Caudoviricetes sp.]